MNLYVGTVRHRRFREREHEFRHRVAFVLADQEELPFRRGPVSLRREDYLELPGRVLTMPRIAGLGFNPVSFYYGDDGEVLAEVTNTPWGERHVYRAGEGIAKAMHVSPLMGMDQQYRFAAAPPGPTLSVHIEVTQDGERAFDATLNLRRRPYATAPLLHGLKTLPFIYAHAAALRLRGVAWHPHPEVAA